MAAGGQNYNITIINTALKVKQWLKKDVYFLIMTTAIRRNINTVYEISSEGRFHALQLINYPFTNR